MGRAINGAPRACREVAGFSFCEPVCEPLAFPPRLAGGRWFKGRSGIPKTNVGAITVLLAWFDIRMGILLDLLAGGTALESTVGAVGLDEEHCFDCTTLS